MLRDEKRANKISQLQQARDEKFPASIKDLYTADQFNAELPSFPSDEELARKIALQEFTELKPGEVDAGNLLVEAMQKIALDDAPTKLEKRKKQMGAMLDAGFFQAYTGQFHAFDEKKLETPTGGWTPLTTAVPKPILKDQVNLSAQNVLDFSALGIEDVACDQIAEDFKYASKLALEDVKHEDDFGNLISETAKKDIASLASTIQLITIEKSEYLAGKKKNLAGSMMDTKIPDMTAAADTKEKPKEMKSVLDNSKGVLHTIDEEFIETGKPMPKGAPDLKHSQLPEVKIPVKASAKCSVQPKTTKVKRPWLSGSSSQSFNLFANKSAAERLQLLNPQAKSVESRRNFTKTL